MKKYLSHTITLLSIIIFLWYGLNNSHIFIDLAKISSLGLVLVAIGRLVNIFANGLFTKWTAEAFTDKKLSPGEGFYVGIISAVGNFFGPLLGGAGIRGIYLKKVHGLPYSKFASTLFGYYLIFFIVICALAIMSLLIIEQTEQTNWLFLFFMSWLGALLLLLVINPKYIHKLKNNKNRKLIGAGIKILIEITDGWHHIKKDKKLLIKLFCLALVGYLANFFIALVAFTAIGVNISIPALGLYSSLVTVSLLISLTPGAVGIREAILLLVAVTLGVTNDQIIQVAIIDRGVNFVLLIILFLLFRNKSLVKKLTSREITI